MEIYPLSTKAIIIRIRSGDYRIEELGDLLRVGLVEDDWLHNLNISGWGRGAYTPIGGEFTAVGLIQSSKVKDS